MTSTQADRGTPLVVKAGPGGSSPAPSRWGLIVPLVLIGVAVGAWQAWARYGQPAEERGDRLFVVTRASFPVILEEKAELGAKHNVIIRNEMDSGTRAGATIIYIVPEGTRVETGDLLVELAADTIEQRIRTQRITVSTAKSARVAANNDLAIQKNLNDANIALAKTTLSISLIEMQEWEQGLRVQQEQQASLALLTADSKKEQAAVQLDVSRKGLAEGIIFEVEYKGTEIDFDTADYAQRNAEVQLGVLKTYTFKKDRIRLRAAEVDAGAALSRAKKTASSEEQKALAAVDQARQALDLSIAELDTLETQLEKSKIRAPRPGQVVYHVERSFRGTSTPIDLGAQVARNRTIMKLPDLSEMELVVQIHEVDVGQIRLGQPARIEVAGVSEIVDEAAEGGARSSGKPKIFNGVVEQVALLADSRNRRLNPDLRVFETKVKILDADPRLKPGMTAMVRIQVDYLEDVISVPIEAIHSQAGTSYVFVQAGEDLAAREVVLGGSSHRFVEVLHGLEVGENVWLDISDAMLTLLPQESEEALAAALQERETKRRLAEASRSGRLRQAGAADPSARQGPGGRDGAGRPGRGGGGGRGNRFERFDTNKDGKITKAEFTGPTQMFERLDGDGDGEITAAEFAAAAARFQGGGQGRRGDRGFGDGGGRGGQGRGGQGRGGRGRGGPGRGGD